METKILETELVYFNEQRNELLKIALGKFVLIKGRELHGIYDDELAAYKAGVAMFGLQPFMIKEVLAEEQIHQIPAHHLDLIHASF